MAREHKINAVNMARETHRSDVLRQLNDCRIQLANEQKRNSSDTIKIVQLIQKLMFICEQYGYL